MPSRPDRPDRACRRPAGRPASPAWPSRWRPLALMVATEPRLAIVWDEGYTLGREARLRLWFRALRDPRGSPPTGSRRPSELVQQDGAPAPAARPDRHPGEAPVRPAGPRLVLAVRPRGAARAPAVLRARRPGRRRPRPRLGRPCPAPGSGRSRVQPDGRGALRVRRRGAGAPGPASLAAGAWVFQPNLFGHGHYATYDALLSCLWVGAILAFARAVEADAGRGRAARAGAGSSSSACCSGCAADTKLTGWFLPLPFLAWVGPVPEPPRGLDAAGRRARRGRLTLYAAQPPVVGRPGRRGRRGSSRSNLTAARRSRSRSLFLGRVVLDARRVAPLVQHAGLDGRSSTPVGFLALALVGVGPGGPAGAEPSRSGCWRSGTGRSCWSSAPCRTRRGTTASASSCRPSASWRWSPAWGRRRPSSGSGAGARPSIAAALVEGAVERRRDDAGAALVFQPGRRRPAGRRGLGMEPTYYWDALTDEALDWLNGPHRARPEGPVRHLPDLAALPPRRPAGSRPASCPIDPGAWAWYVVQNRPGASQPLDRALIRAGRPAYVVSKLGRPAVWIFPYRTEADPKIGPAIGPVAP